MNTITTYENKGAGKTLSAFILTLLVWVLFSSQVLAQTYSGPLVITKGGTYTGNWESRDSEVAAVDVRTSEPVVILNSNIRGAGYLIKSWGHAVNITVKNSKGYGLTPTPWRDYKKPRRFLTVNNFKNVVVENCYMESTAGIYVGTRYEGDGSTNNTVKIRYNKAKNIDGRVYGSSEHSQFTQFNYRGNLPHAEIAWNEIINEPNRSLVEDNINLSNARGTSGSPIRIHNNYIQGAYPLPATETKYSGGGIIADSWYQDGMGDPASIATAYVKVYDNQTVNLGNYNYAIAGGNNIEVFNNRGVNSGLFDDGTRMNTHNVGLYGYDYYKKGATFNAVMRNNVTGVMSQGNLFDKNYFPDGLVKNENNPYVGGNVTKQQEKAEYTVWLAKLSTNGIVLGPNGSAPVTQPAPTEPTPTPTPTPTSPTTSIATSTTTGTGKITRELWGNVHGSSVSAVPVSTKPNSTTGLTIFEAPGGQGNNYGQRVRGYVTAPVSGQYTFWIAADDAAELYLSTSEDPAKKTKIAFSSTWTNAREWTKSANQQSAKIALEAGKRYYIEALHLQGGGGDNLAVGWQLPNGAMERPIAGNRLSEMGSAAPAPTLVSAPVATVTAAVGKITRELWGNVHGSSVSAVPVSTKPSSSTELTIFEAPGRQGNNYGQRVRGYVTAPVSGQYTFWIAADDAAELYLSTSEDPAKKTKIAFSSTWTNAREWTKSASQQSAKITLEAGKRYYIEALHLQGGGGDNLAVGWQLPNGAMERPIAGNRLSPIVELSASTAAALTTQDTNIQFEKVTAYPNPFRDVVTLDMGAEEIKLQEVVILNQTGKVVYKEESLKLDNNKLVLNLSGADLNSGLYFLKYTDSNGKSNTIKLIKE
ncbi:T9SS type A sorting domain-containing protein [Pontibacter sp. JH31]|uniref:T9SS type A sorting domain-containing protein n=1 Tax=Pontibacter aquaedesilientis TaxID=2766980 RepID=A0ABR7XBG4_9BACT|nr:PA14 domain-containing protein [Pontibacter aquaedesilientis]MBD1395622.1 T9SS type A sorting domain-containing protein [Pontibacter aquaedesilientis]